MNKSADDNSFGDTMFTEEGYLRLQLDLDLEVGGKYGK